MKSVAWAVLAAVLLLGSALSAARQTVRFGEPVPVEWFVGPDEDESLPMKMRPLYVRGKLIEFTTGPEHQVGQGWVVVERIFRVSDRLTDGDELVSPHWRWQRDGWLLIESAKGQVQVLQLPQYDPFYSQAAWYGPYAAYCGLSDDGEDLYAVVARVGQEQPLLEKPLGKARGGVMPDSECAPPEWRQAPLRVRFQPRGRKPLELSIPAEEATDGEAHR